MHLPVLVTPASAPFDTAEAKKHLVVEHSDHDEMIASFILAATKHVERVTRVALGAQAWQQDFDSFDQVMRLPIGPVASITSITYRNDAGQLSTVDSDDYALFADALGSYVRFKDDYSLPSGLYEAGAVRVTWVAGAEEAPEPLVAAVKLILGDLYANREAKMDGGIVENPTVKALLSTYRVF